MGKWRRRTVAAGLTGVLVAAPPGLAAEWRLESRVTGVAGFNDNIRATATNQDATAHGSAILNLGLERRDGRLDLELAGRGEASAYTEGDEFNSEEGRITLRAAYAFPVSRIRLSADYNRDSTITTVEDLRGDRREASAITTGTLAGEFTTALTQRDRIRLSADYRRRDFEELNRVDFGVWSADLVWTRSLTPIWSSTAGLSVTAFDPDSVFSDDTLAVGLLLGVVYAPSDRVNLSASLGPEYVERRPRLPGLPTRQETNYTLSLSARYEIDELTSLTGNLTRRTEAGGAGAALTRDRLSLNLAHRWSERLRLSLGTAYLRTEEEQLGLLETREVLQLDAGMNYALAPNLDLGLTYGLRLRTLEGTGDDVMTNTARLTLTYSLPVQRWSE